MSIAVIRSKKYTLSKENVTEAWRQNDFMGSFMCVLDGKPYVYYNDDDVDEFYDTLMNFQKEHEDALPIAVNFSAFAMDTNEDFKCSPFPLTNDVFVYMSTSIKFSTYKKNGSIDILSKLPDGFWHNEATMILLVDYFQADAMCFFDMKTNKPTLIADKTTVINSDETKKNNAHVWMSDNCFFKQTPKPLAPQGFPFQGRGGANDPPPNHSNQKSTHSTVGKIVNTPEGKRYVRNNVTPYVMCSVCKKKKLFTTTEHKTGVCWLCRNNITDNKLKNKGKGKK